MLELYDPAGAFEQLEAYVAAAGCDVDVFLAYGLSEPQRRAGSGRTCGWWSTAYRRSRTAARPVGPCLSAGARVYVGRARDQFAVRAHDGG